MGANLSFVKELSTKMRRHKFMLSYRGFVSEEITMSLLHLAERKLELDGTYTSTKKKVFNVMVECLQNISKHTGENVPQKDSLFMVGKINDKYVIYSGNIIPNDKVLNLENKLQAVNVMSKEELTDIYRKLIVEASFSGKGNAGLGLIDIAKKSGNKLDYEFIKINEESSYFTLSTSINIVIPQK